MCFLWSNDKRIYVFGAVGKIKSYLKFIDVLGTIDLNG